MDRLGVRIERLPSMRMARVGVTASNAEQRAFDLLRAFAVPRGLMRRDDDRVFGFDNCQPDPNHRYTCLLPVPDGVRGEGEVDVVDVPGATYAVVTARGADTVHRSWGELSDWCVAHGYRRADRQGLEELVSRPGAPPEELVLDLYLPIEA